LVQSPLTRHKAKNASFTPEEQIYVKSEINKLLSKGVIIETHHEQYEYVSPIFTVAKAGVRGLDLF